MIELSQREIEVKRFENKEAFALFFYTPLCGTCKLSEQMLKVVLKMAPTLSLYKCNINLMPSLAQAWKLESIPCLIILEKGVPFQKVYAFKSVVHLYQILQPLLDEMGE